MHQNSMAYGKEEKISPPKTLLPAISTNQPKNISIKFRPKIACQAPKLPNSLNRKEIELAF
jgi:hypothetical protein